MAHLSQNAVDGAHGGGREFGALDFPLLLGFRQGVVHYGENPIHVVILQGLAITAAQAKLRGGVRLASSEV